MVMMMAIVVMVVVMMVMRVNNGQSLKVSDYRMQVLDIFLRSQLFGKIMVDILISFYSPVVHKSTNHDDDDIMIMV